MIHCLANGFGFNGKGWVGEACSPGRLDAGTFLSSIGNNDSPFSLFNTNTNPCLVICTTASICFKSCVMVTKAGGAGRS